jgi:hypothetical protein
LRTINFNQWVKTGGTSNLIIVAGLLFAAKASNFNKSDEYRSENHGFQNPLAHYIGSLY